MALAGAMCYLELGLLMRKTGGEYAILLETYFFQKKNRWVEMLDLVSLHLDECSLAERCDSVHHHDDLCQVLDSPLLHWL